MLKVTRQEKLFEIVVQVILSDRTAEYSVERTTAEMVGILKLVSKQGRSREA